MSSALDFKRLVVSALVVCLVSSVLPTSVVVNAAVPGPQAGYPLDAGSGTTVADVSGNGLSGTLVGASWTTGKYNNALSFNGSTSYVDLGNPAALQLTGSASWSAWVFATATPADDGNIIAKSLGIAGWQFKTSPDTGQHRFAIGITAPGNLWVQRNSNTIRALNTWYYVAGVYNAAAQTLDMYVNGALDNGPLTGAGQSNVTVPSSQLNFAGTSVNLGRRSDNGYRFAGTIDEVRIYSRALSAAEIQSDMNTPLGAPDTQLPSAPGAPVPSVIGSTQINLAWPASTDNVGVTGYQLERCQGTGCNSFAQIATPSGTSFNNTGLTPATSYSYRVRATDAASNLSPFSAVATAATAAAPDTQAPTAPGTPALSVIGSTQINLAWAASTDNVGVTGYLLERCQTAGCSNFIQIATPASAAYSDTGLTASTSYSYRVRATDAAGNLSGYSSVATTATNATPDTIAPTTPGTPVPNVISSTQINLTWAVSTDNVAVTGYQLERCQNSGCNAFAQIATPSGASFSDTGRTASTSYSYRVRASDAAGNLSAYSGVASATTNAAVVAGPLVAYPFDTGSGTTVADVSGNGLSGTLVGASWTTGKYNNALSFNGSTSYVDLGNPAALQLTGSASWSAWVFATATPADDGNIIAKSLGIAGWQFKTSPDTGQHRFAIGITAPGNLWVQRNSNTIRALNTWYYVAGVYNAAAQTLDMYVNGALDNGPLTGAGQSNVTVPSSQLNFAGTSVNLGRRSDNGYRFAGTIDEVRIYSRALSAAEIQSDMNTPLGAPDTQLPSAPGAPVPSVIGSTQINLAWPASTDNVGVTGYQLERCQGTGCNSFAQIAIPSGTSFNNTGLTVATSYSYRVRATDAAGNLSGYSAVATATTAAAAPDTQAPTAPGTPALSVIGSTQINLTWAASTDNVAVTGYLLERCQGMGCNSFAQIATPTGTSFNNTGLMPATSYSYRVRATDAAANLSDYSGAATTSTSATTAPVFVREAHSATDGCCGLQFNNATLSLNVTGTDRLLIVAWHSEWDGVPDPNREAQDPGAWSVTNNGTPGTVITQTNGYKGPDGNRKFRIYYWLNPPPGTNTIQVSNANTGPNELSVSAVLFNNVDQANPLGDVVLDVSTADRTSESETVNTAPSDLVLHVIGDAVMIPGTLGSGETAISFANDGLRPENGDASLWLSTKLGASPTTTVTSSNWWLATVLNGVGIVLHGH